MYASLTGIKGRDASLLLFRTPFQRLTHRSPFNKTCWIRSLVRNPKDNTVSSVLALLAANLGLMSSTINGPLKPARND